MSSKRQLKTGSIRVRATSQRRGFTINVTAKNYNEARKKVLKETGSQRLLCGIKPQLQRLWK